MPNQQIDAALVTEFSDMVHVKAQQIQSRLRPFARLKNFKSGDEMAYDGIGTVEATEVSGRIQPTVFNEIDHLRRKISRRRFVVTLPIDASDVRAVLISPDSEYAGACVRAMERAFDKIGIEALFADVLTGRTFGTTVTFASDGGTTVTATAGFTYEKILEIRKNFRNEEVGSQTNETIALLVTADETDQWFKEIEIISGDFSRRFVVDNGEISSVLGMKVIEYGADVDSPLLSVSSGTRSCAALSSRGLCYGISTDLKLDIEKRPDYVETTQVQAIIQMGAVRTEGVLIQKVTTTTA